MKNNLTICRDVLQFIKPRDIPAGIATIEAIKSSMPEVPQYTLLSSDFFKAMLDSSSLFNSISGEASWVQAGVWRGGGALFLRAMIESLGCAKKIHLYDTFDAIPVDGLGRDLDKDFIEGLSLVKNLEIAPASVKEIENLFDQFSLGEGVEICQGNILDLKVCDVPERISFLHLDLDFYEPTYHALEVFYDNVVPGGIIIIDDYYMRLLSCRDAVDDFLEEKKISRSILEKFSNYSVKFTKP